MDEDECYLFAYGSLRPNESPPKTMELFVQDSIQADQIQFESSHKYAEIDFEGKIKKVPGYTLLIANSELPTLDEREAPDYKRVAILTNRGFNAWVYEYVGTK